MARHSAPRPSTARRAVLALTTASVALGAGATTTAADSESARDLVPPKRAVLGKTKSETARAKALTGFVRQVTGPVEGIGPNPLAGTGVDPLDNGVGTRIVDFRPTNSRELTGPVVQPASVGGIPLLGRIPGLLHG